MKGKVKNGNTYTDYKNCYIFGVEYYRKRLDLTNINGKIGR